MLVSTLVRFLLCRFCWKQAYQREERPDLCCGSRGVATSIDWAASVYNWYYDLRSQLPLSNDILRIKKLGYQCRLRISWVGDESVWSRIVVTILVPRTYQYGVLTGLWYRLTVRHNWTLDLLAVFATSFGKVVALWMLLDQIKIVMMKARYFHQWEMMMLFHPHLLFPRTARAMELQLLETRRKTAKTQAWTT